MLPPGCRIVDGRLTWPKKASAEHVEWIKQQTLSRLIGPNHARSTRAADVQRVRWCVQRSLPL